MHMPEIEIQPCYIVISILRLLHYYIDISRIHSDPLTSRPRSSYWSNTWLQLSRAAAAAAYQMAVICTRRQAELLNSRCKIGRSPLVVDYTANKYLGSTCSLGKGFAPKNRVLLTKTETDPSYSCLFDFGKHAAGREQPAFTCHFPIRPVNDPASALSRCRSFLR